MRLDFNGNSYIGVHAKCTEKYVLVSPYLSEATADKLSSTLDARVIRMLIGDSSAIGSLVAGNSQGFVVSSFASYQDVKKIKSDDAKVVRLPGRLNAAGNLILANDTTALVHPKLTDRALESVRRALNVDVYMGTIGKLGNVGMAAVATNTGLLVHPKVTDSELAFLEEKFRLPVDIGTVNSGFPFVGSALLANSKGYAAGSETTGAELGRIEDALGFIEKKSTRITSSSSPLR
jgi:translation initiation factor 6